VFRVGTILLNKAVDTLPYMINIIINRRYYRNFNHFAIYLSSSLALSSPSQHLLEKHCLGIFTVSGSKADV
jgi:hypothetical protein